MDNVGRDDVNETLTDEFAVLTPDEVAEVWPYVEGGVERALATSDGEATVGDTLSGLVGGRTKLALLRRDGALLGVVFQFLAFPRYRIARILLAFGRDMKGVADVIERAEAYAHDNGCRYVEGWVATSGRERLFAKFGYERQYVIVRKRV